MTTQVAMQASVAQKRKRGFTLTEIAIVLGIVGLILGAIWTAAAAVYQNQRVAHLNTEILQIAQGIRTLYASSANDAGLTTDSLVCAKAVPSDLVVGACGGPATMSNPFPGGTTAVYVPGTNDSFTIEVTNISQSACISALMAVAGTTRDPGLFYAGATAAAQAAAVATAAPSALVAVATPALANAAIANNFGGCNASGANGSVAIRFSFGLKS